VLINAGREQVCALYDAFPDHLRPAVLLGAVVGLRPAEVVGLRVIDVDFMRGVMRPLVQRAARSSGAATTS
jgi:integrase